VKVLSDGWTAVTRDKQLSAQFEHSVGITETGVEFFTLSPMGLAKPPYDLGPAKPADQRQTATA
jgi:methionyl aminopeptidase